jgi:hypothetical protein
MLSTNKEICNDVFNNALAKQNIKLLQNTPIGINVYGVSSSTKGTDNFERLKTIRIGSISIPYVYNRFDEIHVNISEAQDGDYFYIDPEIGIGYSSFVDYIERMGEDIRAYMVMHELVLRESWVDSDGNLQFENTHKEFHIIDINEDDEDDVINRRFDATIKYRPICMKCGLNNNATIIDTIKIINTVDNSSYEVTGSFDIPNPNKYGKKIKKLDFNNESRPIVNVYNKNTSFNRNGFADITGSGNISGSKTIGSLSGTFSFSENEGVSGDYSGSLSGLGNLIGNISGTFKDGYFSGNISGTISDLGGFISGTFSNPEFGVISGTISGYIPGIGYISGTIIGNYSNNGLGEITGTITSTGSTSNISSINGSSSISSSSSSINDTNIINNGGGRFVVENMTQNITSFIESTNIAVSITEIPPEYIN